MRESRLPPRAEPFEKRLSSFFLLQSIADSSATYQPRAGNRSQPWFLRNVAQRFFWAAAIRLRASGLKMRRLRSRDDVDAVCELASAVDLFEARAALCPIMLRTCAICSSRRCRCVSSP